MICLYCEGDTKVTNSRSQKRNNQIWRRRKCLKCGAVFTSHEGVDYSSTLLVNTPEGSGPFLEDLLFSELLNALKHRKDAYSAAREATATVIKDLLKLPSKPLFSPKEISRAAGAVLAKLDKQAHLRFVAEHPSLQD